jgi:hypothetical protein
VSIGGIVCSRLQGGTRNPLISPAESIGIFDLNLRKNLISELETTSYSSINYRLWMSAIGYQPSRMKSEVKKYFSIPVKGYIFRLHRTTLGAFAGYLKVAPS